MSADRYSLDSNILIYSINRSDGAKHERALEVVDRSVERDCVLTVQSLAEFVAALTRKNIVPKPAAVAQVHDWLELFPTVAADAAAFDLALGEFESGRLSFWDALLLATANRAGCLYVLSEDMHDGTRLDTVTVRNPLAGRALPDDLHQLLGIG